ncbi:hypothetical protein [Spirosoma gilvum]
MKILLRLSLYAFLIFIWSCTDHRIPAGITCEEFTRRITTCITWRLTSRTVNNVEAIQACQRGITLNFPGGKFGQLAISTVDPEFCGGIAQGGYSCSNGTITLSKTVDFGGFSSAGPFTETLNFLSPTSFLLTYTDSKGNAVAETYVAAC